MKKIALLSILFFSACTPTSPLTSSRWSGKGEIPHLGFLEVDLKTESTETSQDEVVQMSQQNLEGFVVEGAFLKTIKTQKEGLVFQSFSLAKAATPFKGMSAAALDRKKEHLWSQYKQKHPVVKNEKQIFPIEVIFLSHPKLRPALRIYTETGFGLVRATYLNEHAEVVSEQFVGSSLAEMIESPSFAFILGPKKSSLSSVLLNRNSLPEGLSDAIIDVTSASPAKITLNTSLELQPTDERFDQVQAFYYSHQIIQWFNQKAGIKIPNKVHILTHLGFPEKTNAAFYFKNQIRLGQGDDITYSNIAWDPTIVMHETSHAVIDSLTHLPFQGEGGSINEGYADFFTTFYLDNPLLGENSYLTAPYKRTVDQNLKLSEKNGGLYHDSAIVSGLFWNLKKRIPPEKVLTFAIRVLNRLGPNSNWSDFKLSLQEQSPQIFSGDELKIVHQLMKERELL